MQAGPPRNPPAELACQCGGGAQRCCEWVRHPNHGGEFPKVHEELLVRASTGRLPPLSQCYQAEDALEAFPLSGGKARARSQVTIDDLDLLLLPAQRTHPFGHRILEELTFLILPYLFVAGLPKVDDRLASQMLRFDFGIVQDLCHYLFSPPRERPLLERGP